MKRTTALRMLAGAATVPYVQTAARADDIPLRMATINIDSGAQPYFAQDAGFFKAAGLRADFREFNNGQVIAAAVAGGALDIGLSNPVAMAQAHAKHIPFVIIGPGALYLASQPTTLMMVPKASTIKSARDFTGKTIAMNGINGIPQYCARAWVDKNGGDSTGMKFVELNFAQMMDALGSARVDAASVTEPFISEARTTGRSLGAFFDACAPRFVLSIYIATQAWAQANPDAIRRFQSAMAKTAAWANKNQAQSGDILMKYTKLPERTVHTMRRAVFAEKWNSSEVQPLVDLTVKYGSGVTPFAIDEMLYRA